MALNIGSYLSTTKYAAGQAVSPKEDPALEAQEVAAESALLQQEPQTHDFQEEEPSEIHEIHEISENGETPKITIQDAELSLSPAKPSRSAGDLNGERKETDISVQTLDMQKAISDMQKDHILHQYQFFVGGNNTINL
ncbi:MAG: hypothetical protein K6A92_09780 [Lachnospiraceae bacterium]|nr:hypothetical protein [Lachnospiraceae bacterium]